MEASEAPSGPPGEESVAVVMNSSKPLHLFVKRQTQTLGVGLPVYVVESDVNTFPRV